ncbi:MAG: DNRLRE domain-containing protein [Chloroflexota bacterium]
MSTHGPRIEIAVRVFLIAMVLFNALVPTAAEAQPTRGGDEKADIVTQSAERTLPETTHPIYQPSTATAPPAQTDTDPEPEGEPPTPPKDPVEFMITAAPGRVSPKGEIHFKVLIRNHTEDSISNLTFYDPLENGLDYSDNLFDAIKYDSDKNRLVYEIGKLEAGGEFTFKYTLTLTERADSGEKVWVHNTEIEYMQEEEILAQTATASFVDGAGAVKQESYTAVVEENHEGWVSVGLVNVYLEEGAVSQDGLIVASPLEVESGPEMQFELDMFDTTPVASGTDGEPVEQEATVQEAMEVQFETPAYIEVNLDGFIELAQMPGEKKPYVATYDEESQIWVKVPILATNVEANTVTVAAAHFSTWGAGLGDSLPQNGANVLLFDQPYTSLFTGSSRYSIPIWTPPGRAGMAPDISLAYSSGTVDGVLGDVQAPYVGVGWNIDGVEIVRKITTDENGYGYENDFALTINGTLYDLLVDPNQPSRYYTKENAFLYVERHNEALGNDDDNGDPVENDTHEWWEVVTTDGTRYRLGWNKDSEQLALMYGYACTTGSPCTTPDGSYASLGYAGIKPDLVALRWRVDMVTDTNGNFMTYTYLEEQPAGSSHTPLFDRASYPSAIFYTGHGSEENPDPDYGYQVVFDYGYRSNVGDGVPLAFNLWDNYDTRFLDAIRICYQDCTTGKLVRTYDLEYDKADVPNANGTLILTSLKITGEGGSHATSDEGNVIVPETESATIKFTYINLDNRALSGTQEEFPYPRLESIENGYGAVLFYTYENDERGTSSWYNWRVKEVSVSSGVSTAAVHTYLYEDPVYSGANDTGSLIGFTTVTDQTMDFNGTTVLAQSRHTFGTTGLDTGHELVTEMQDAGGTTLRKTINTYVTDNSMAPFYGWNYRYLYSVQNYVRSGGSLTLASKTVTIHDPSTGNLAVRQDYLGSSLYRKEYFEYRPNFNPSVYILDKPTRRVLVDAGNAAFAETIYGYDGGVGNSPTKGNLTLTQSLKDDDEAVSVTMSYDEYGNVETTCAYTTYQMPGVLPSGTCRLTTTTYEEILYTYPVASTNPLGQITTTDYILTLGLPYRVTDANNWITETAYDGLGRTREVTPPGLGQAGVKYTYPTPTNGSVSAPYGVHMEIWDEIGNTYRDVWGLYDGLGRMLQSQTYDAGNLSDPWLVTSTTYNTQGLADQQSLPFYAAGQGGADLSGASQFTITEYDALGRAIQVTAPGGITTSTSYDGLTATVTDPNGNKVSRTSDGLGRLVSVKEYNGEAVYATTYYSYDIADRLKTTTDAQGNQTHISYDWLGRKTGMDDPDMGVWTYVYDPFGSLTSQTDARGTTLTFEYDALNRLTLKRVGTGGTVLATYTYGNTAGYYGFRVGMTDLSGSATWDYSNYGRTVAENRTIGGTLASTTTTSDWLGRVKTITYPDGEVLTYGYDALGRPNDLDTSQTANLARLAYSVVNNIALSQIGTITLGNGVTVTNTYDSQTHRLEARTAQKGASAPILDFAYEYDPAGNILSIEDAALGETSHYEYDFLNRLVYAEAVTNNDYAYRQSYEYDQVGNILSVSSWQESDLIFKDDFEGESFANWSAAVLGTNNDIWFVGEDGFIPPQGGQSIVLDINDDESIYLQDDTPADETHYRARFYLHTNDLVMAGGDALDLLVGYKNGAAVLRVQVQKSGGAYQVRAGALNDAGAWVDSAWHDLAAGWNSIEVEYQAVSGSGSLTLWLNDAEEESLTAIDNDTRAVTEVRLGAQGVESGTDGQVLLDAFESRRVTYIGPLAQAGDGAAGHVLAAYRGPNFPASDPATISFQDGVYPDANYSGTSDTQIFNTYPTTNYGTNSDIGVGERNDYTDRRGRTLIQFDLSAIPADATILSATLSLWTSTDKSSNDRTIRVYRLKAPFNETQATWNVSATGANWQTAGASGADDRESTDIGSALILASEPLNTEKQITLDAAAIQELVDGTFTNNGLVVIADTELDDRFSYKSSEASTASQRPKLTIQYTVGEATATATPTETASATPTATDTPVPTATPSPSVTPTNTVTRTPSKTLVASLTPTPSKTPTPSITNTPTKTPTKTPSPTKTPTPSRTPTNTPVPIGVASWNFDETSGTTVNDSIGSVYSNGTIVGALRVPGFGLNALEFAAGRRVDVARKTEQEPANGFTISLWVFPTQVNSGTTYVLLNKGGTAQDYRLYINSDGYLVFKVNDLDPDEVTGPRLPLDTWTHVAAVYDRPAGLIKLYINGTLAASRAVTGTVSFNTAGITFGASTDPFVGLLDEIGLFSGAIPDSQISTLAGLYATATPHPTSTATPTITFTPSRTPTNSATPVHTYTPSQTPTSTFTPSPTVSPTPLPMGDLPWGSGDDGDLTVDSGVTYNINTQNQPGRTCADGGDAVAYSVTTLGSTAAVLSVTPSAGCLNEGDEILLINLQGTSTSTYNAGNYEFLRVDYITDDTVVFTTPKTKWYGDGWRSDANIGTTTGKQKVAIVRVPNYEDVTVNGTLTGSVWGGKYVVVFRAAGTLTGGGTIQVNALGGSNGDGSGIGDGYEGASAANDHPAGGAGGYGTEGANASSSGGGVYGEPSLNKIFRGSGGGQGGDCTNCSPSNGGAGGVGGGILFIAGQTINFSGTLSSNGGSGHEPGGGGGSGGSIRIEGYDLTLNNLSAAGATSYSHGGAGRIAVYYVNSQSITTSNPSAYVGILGEPPTPTPTPTSYSTGTPSPWGTGSDGNLTVATAVTFNIHTDNSNSHVCADGGDGVSYDVIELTASWAKLSAVPSDGCLNAGDEVMLINLRAWTPAYHAGRYEFLRVGGVSGDMVYFTTPKENYYGDGLEDDLDIGPASGKQWVALVRVPNYNNVTVDGVLKGNDWNPVAFRAAGTLSGGGTIQVNALGGGNGDGLGTGDGEEGAGTPNNHTGGGGGGYGTNGATASGSGGGTYGEPSLTRIYRGSRGGQGGDCDNCNPVGGGAGGDGGGILFIAAQTINFTGSLTSNGGGGHAPGGGSGSGGSIRIEGQSITIAALSAVGGTTNADGGVGRIAVYYLGAQQPTITTSNPTPFVWTLGVPTHTPTPTMTHTPAVTYTPTNTPAPTPTPQLSWVERVYQYEGSQPHAVTSLMSDQSSVGSYQYDANGNMTCRMEDGQWFIQGYNDENRIASISRLDGPCGSGNILESWFYLYDGDGVRVEERYLIGTTLTSTKAYFPSTSLRAGMGGLYEVTDGAVKKYYSIAGQTVALRDDSGLQYLLTDHLGSVVAVTNASGTLTSQQRYLPFGEVRTIPDSPITITDFGFTGQRALSGTGLMDYRARFYSQSLGRFLQPDSLIPSAENPQSWNRYAYVINRPINLNDPTGHKYCDGEFGCDPPPSDPEPEDPNDELETDGGNNDSDSPDEASCMVHISDNYWANVCGGETGSNFTHIFFTNPGHEGYYLGVYYDSPLKTLAEDALNLFLSVFNFPAYRLPWKRLVVSGTEVAVSAGVDRATTGIDAWDDSLGAAISDAADYKGGRDVNLLVFTNVYNRVATSNRGSGSPIFSESSRFVVLVQPAGESRFVPMYISNVYLNNFQNYYGIP